MHWIITNALGVVLVLSAMNLWAQQVPVTDTGVQSAISSASSTVANSLTQVNETVGTGSKATVEAINANNKVLANINQALANALVQIAKTTETIQQSRRNADLYDPSMGAKPQSSCGVLSSTVAVSAGDTARHVVTSKLNNFSEKHLERSKYLPDDTSLLTDRSNRMRMLKEKEQALNAEVGPLSIVGDQGLPVTEDDNQSWVVLHTKMMNMAVPNPVNLPVTEQDAEALSDDEIGIKTSANLIQIDRQEMVTEIISDSVAGRTKTYNADWVKALLYKSSNGELQGVSEEILADIDAGVSRTDIETILNTYRLKNPSWVTFTAARANEVGLARDRNIMQAQSLELQHSLLKEARRTNLLLAYIHAHQIEQSGPPLD